MRTRLLIWTILAVAIAAGWCPQLQSLAATQDQANALADSSSSAEAQSKGTDAKLPQATNKLDEIIDRIIEREHDEIAAFDLHAPVIETYAQEVKFDAAMGTVPKSDFYFLGQADFRGRLKVHSMAGSSRKGSLMWSFEPAGFLQMIYIDRGEFDKAHYRFKYSGREFLGEVRCLVFDVSPGPKVRRARFVGRIWVEDQDFTVVRINGKYAPAIHFSLKRLEDEYYLHFDSWRTNVKSGLWLPSLCLQPGTQPALALWQSQLQIFDTPVGLQTKAGFAGRGTEQAAGGIRESSQRRSDATRPLPPRSPARMET